MYLLPEHLENQLSLASLTNYKTTVFEHYVPNVRNTRCNLKNSPIVKK